MINAKVISVKESPQYKVKAIQYFIKHWATEESAPVYKDCITSCITTKNSLPQWYLLINNNEDIIGCAGLITNDFISRMDLYPWICALFIEESCRGNGLGAMLIEKAKQDAKNGGFETVYLCTDHIGYYEKYGFEKIATGYHPWGETSSIYFAKT